MNEEELSDQSFWLGIAMKVPELLADPEGTEHLVDRFVGQYLQVLIGARGQQNIERVWLAYWHYLVAPRTRRKPFCLSGRAADLLITEFQNALANNDRQASG